MGSFAKSLVSHGKRNIFRFFLPSPFSLKISQQTHSPRKILIFPLNPKTGSSTMVKAAIAIYNRTIIFFLLPFYFLLLISCEKQTTPVTLPNPQLTLTVEDAAVTEAWLRLRAQETAAEQQIIIWRDSSEIYNLGGAITDTTLHDSALLPAYDYTYRAELRKNGQKISDTEPVSITTMDTTSHDFQWEIFEFGGVHGSSVLYDVVIVNENDIWAVGELYVNTDSLPWKPYSASHWNGQEWELKRFTYISNSSEIVIAPVRGIWVLSNDDIWLAAGSIFHWDGNIATLSYQRNISTQETIEKLWINSSSEIYGVGNEGLIVHYTGSSWYRIESGTELDFRDVWGAWNSQGQYWEIVAVASKLYINYDRLIFQIKPSYALLSDSGINWPLLAVWFSSGRKYYVAGSGIYEKHQFSERQWQNGPLDITHYTIFGMRGNAINDIVAAGGVGEIIHFNGMTWKSFFDVTQLGYGNYYAVDMEGDIIIAVGQDAPRATIAVGRRYSPEN